MLTQLNNVVRTPESMNKLMDDEKVKDTLLTFRNFSEFEIFGPMSLRLTRSSRHRYVFKWRTQQ